MIRLLEDLWEVANGSSYWFHTNSERHCWRL